MHVQSLLAGALALAPSASAHFLFPHLMLNGVRTGAYEYVREHDFGFMPHNNDWINSPDFRCNEGSWRHRREPKTAVVTAGVDVVGFNLHLDFDLYHPGPVTIYLSRAPGDVRDYDGSGDWFKVYQLGTRQPFNGTDEGWATWKMKNWQFRLPAEIPAGEYLMRIEQMSVHPPYRQKEWYVQCAHLKINSNYNGPAPGPTIKIPGGYKISDPAIQYDQWAQPPPTYAPMPGPPLWPNNNPQQGNPNQGGNNGGGNQGGGNGGCTVPKWGQCGGQGYSGCRNCESGSTCRAQNDWYSQCL